MTRTRVLERAYAAVNRAAWDEALDLLPDDFVFHPLAQSLDPEPIRGRDALRAYMEPDLFERQWVELREIAEDGDWVLVSAVGGGLTRSGARIEQSQFHRWRFEGDVPREVWVHNTRDEAERASGLR